MITFCSILAIFCQKEGCGHMLKGRNQNLTYSTGVSQFLGMFLCKTFCSSTSQFCGYNDQRSFFLISTHFFNFGCFSRYHAHIFDKNKFDFPMQNLILNRLVSIGKFKNQNNKAHVAFSIWPILFLDRFN